MKIIIAGSRDCPNYDLVANAVRSSPFSDKITEVVCGMARGADKFGEQYAFTFNIPVKYFPANWDEFGKSAGFRRNEEMAKYADGLILVWDGKSKGSGHMLALAKKYNLQIFERIYQ